MAFRFADKQNWLGPRKRRKWSYLKEWPTRKHSSALLTFVTFFEIPKEIKFIEPYLFSCYLYLLLTMLVVLCGVCLLKSSQIGRSRIWTTMKITSISSQETGWCNKKKAICESELIAFMSNRISFFSQIISAQLKRLWPLSIQSLALPFSHICMAW